MFRKRGYAEDFGTQENDTFGGHKSYGVGPQYGSRNGYAVQGYPQASEGRERVIRQWQRDAEQLSLLVPEFNLEEAVKNSAFTNSLMQGATVFEAYLQMSRVATQKPREEIAQNARNARRGTGGSVLNPAKLSSKDFNKYIESIRDNG